ncbi:MAG: succinate dehydrogenase, cytochrome b556 subunit [Methylocystis sp.]
MIENGGNPKARPRAPDLQIYRPTLTMTMSIAHRMTGAALYMGTLLLVWWLMAISGGSSSYALQQRFMNSFPGRAILLFFTWRTTKPISFQRERDRKSSPARQG